MDQGIVYYTRSYKKIFSILSDVFPILNFLLLVFRKFTRIVKLTFAKKSTSELLFENVQPKHNFEKKKFFDDINKNININNEESNDIISINIKRNGIFDSNKKNNKYERGINNNSSFLNFNTDSNKIFEHKNSNSKEFNNTAEKRPSYLVLNKNDIAQDKKQINDVNLLGILNKNQIFKKKNTIINGKRNYMILDFPKLENERKINTVLKKNKIKDLFPTSYYFMDIFIDKFIKPKSFCCMDKKYFIVYNFMGHIFDINSHILLIKNFNIFKNIFFNEFIVGHKLEHYTIDKRININDEKLMKEINNDLNDNTCDIFTKSLLI